MLPQYIAASGLRQGKKGCDHEGLEQITPHKPGGRNAPAWWFIARQKALEQP
jgi:hypothetical protein